MTLPVSSPGIKACISILFKTHRQMSLNSPLFHTIISTIAAPLNWNSYAMQVLHFLQSILVAEWQKLSMNVPGIFVLENAYFLRN